MDMECNKVSRTLVYSYRSQTWKPKCTEYAKMVAGYFGADSPLANRFGIGKALRTDHGTRQLMPVNDRLGYGLITILVPGGYWDIQHRMTTMRLWSAKMPYARE
jgi:hypothetical protein